MARARRRRQLPGGCHVAGRIEGRLPRAPTPSPRVSARRRVDLGGLRPAPRHCTASESSSPANAIERDNGAWITRERVRARMCARVRVCVFARACVPFFRPRALPAEHPKRVQACAALLSLLARQLSSRQPVRIILYHIYRHTLSSLTVKNARPVCLLYGEEQQQQRPTM